ncbi:unnamed protein product [Clavelina lepadiformis]|uniref:Uncharacterized protein n=1 Tax=Clavelina lepadiformis TaxID=159417 RepID=A0ABP0GAX2_CLALP
MEAASAASACIALRYSLQELTDRKLPVSRGNASNAAHAVAGHGRLALNHIAKLFDFCGETTHAASHTIGIADHI